MLEQSDMTFSHYHKHHIGIDLRHLTKNGLYF